MRSGWKLAAESVRSRVSATVLALATTTLSLSILGCGESDTAPRPDIVLIMADDMGSSDLGSYGGEIETPIWDRLAGGGLRFS